MIFSSKNILEVEPQIEQLEKLQERRPARVVECLRAQLTRLNKAIYYIGHSLLTSLNQLSYVGVVVAVKVVISDHETLLEVHGFAPVHGAALQVEVSVPSVNHFGRLSLQKIYI